MFVLVNGWLARETRFQSEGRFILDGYACVCDWKFSVAIGTGATPVLRELKLFCVPRSEKIAVKTKLSLFSANNSFFILN